MSNPGPYSAHTHIVSPLQQAQAQQQHQPQLLLTEQAPPPTADAPQTEASAEAGVVGKLSTLDRFLPVWILAAMAVGLLAGRLVPGLGQALGAVAVDGVSLPIALGLLVMMYPVLAKVRYDRLDTVTGDRRLLVSSLVLNWLIGPALMFALAWLLQRSPTMVLIPGTSSLAHLRENAAAADLLLPPDALAELDTIGR